jgi:hypothetical protein
MLEMLMLFAAAAGGGEATGRFGGSVWTDGNVRTSGSGIHGKERRRSLCASEEKE